MIRKRLYLVLSVLTSAALLGGAASAFAIGGPCCDQTFTSRLTVVAPTSGRVTDSLAPTGQINCGADCTQDYSWQKICDADACEVQDPPTETLTAVEGPAGYAPSWSACAATATGNCKTGPAGAPQPCGSPDCDLTMDKDTRVSLTWVDVTAPTVALASPPSRVGPSSVFTATGSDNSGSVAKVRFWIDSEPGSSDDTSSPFQYSVAVGNYVNGSTHDLHFRSYDPSGNASADGDQPFTIDHEANVTIDGATPAEGATVNQASPQVDFTLSDVQNGNVSCSVNGVVTTNCVSGLAITGEGVKNVSVTATDDVGNTQTAMRGFTVDRTAPTLSIDSPADGAYLRTAFTPGLTANDALDSSLELRCGLDAPATGDCGAVPLPSDGTHTLNVKARDNAGNETFRSSTFHVDTVAPAPSFTSGPAANAILGSPDVTFGFAASDASPLTWTCSLDGGAFNPCTSSSSQQLTALAEGPHSLIVRATDAAGNQGDVSRAFTVNAVRPTVSIVVGPGEGEIIRANHVTFGFASAGGAAQCSLDSESAFRSCSGADSDALSGLSDGAHTFRVRVRDEVGDEVVASRTFRVDTSVPVPPITLKDILNPTISSAYKAFAKYTIYKRLVLNNVPRGATVTVTCKGRKCPAKKFTKTGGGTVKLSKFAKKKLAAGTTLDIQVTRAGAIGKRFLIKIRKAKKPTLRISPIS